jgi:hypothetical protein
MRRLWLVLAAICGLNATLLSGCPVTPPPAQMDHGDSGAGGGM